MHPNTPSQPQHVIDDRAAKVFYHDVDMALAFGLFGAHSYFHGAYAATNTVHFYRLAQNMRVAYELVTHRTFVPAVVGNYLYDKGDGIRRSDMVDSTGYTSGERQVAGLFPAIVLSISNLFRSDSESN